MVRKERKDMSMEHRVTQSYVVRRATQILKEVEQKELRVGWTLDQQQLAQMQMGTVRFHCSFSGILEMIALSPRVRQQLVVQRGDQQLCKQLAQQ